MSRTNFWQRNHNSRRPLEKCRTRDTCCNKNDAAIPESPEERTEGCSSSETKSEHFTSNSTVIVDDDCEEVGSESGQSSARRDKQPYSSSCDPVTIDVADEDEDDCLMFVRQTTSSFKSKHRRKSGGLGSSRKPSSQASILEIISSESDESDVECSSQIRVQWEKAALRKHNCKGKQEEHTVAEDECSASGSTIDPKTPYATFETNIHFEPEFNISSMDGAGNTECNVNTHALNFSEANSPNNIEEENASTSATAPDRDNRNLPSKVGNDHDVMDASSHFPSDTIDKQASGKDNVDKSGDDFRTSISKDVPPTDTIKGPSAVDPQDNIICECEKLDESSTSAAAPDKYTSNLPSKVGNDHDAVNASPHFSSGTIDGPAPGKENFNKSSECDDLRVSILKDVSPTDIDIIKGPSAVDSNDNIIGEREKHKESIAYKLAEQEEWEARHKELEMQAEEARKLKKRKKADKLRMLDMEKRQKLRLEEVRETQKKDEETIQLKERLRGQVRKKVDLLEMKYNDMASLLSGLGIQVGGRYGPSEQEVNGAYRRAILRYHPDRTSRCTIQEQIESEEIFKLISRFKEKRPLLLGSWSPQHPY